MTTRRATRQKRLDLWLNHADFARLTELAEAWQVSRQRIIESALTYADTARRELADTAKVPRATMSESYTRHQRIPVNLDGLSLMYVDRLAKDTGAVSDGIRLALRAFYAAQRQQDQEGSGYSPHTWG